MISTRHGLDSEAKDILENDNAEQTLEVFIINLVKSTDRAHRMKQNIARWQSNNQAFKNKINFSFFTAKTPQDVQDSGFNKRYDRFLAWVWKARDVRPGEFACFLSHYTLWQKCVEIDRAIFILEDDVDLCCNFGEGAIDIASSPYEYVRFCWSTFRKMILVNDKFAFGHPLILGAWGYYITPVAAKKFIKNSDSIYCGLDYYMSHSFLNNVVEMVYMRPLVRLNELDCSSTIGKPEHQVRSEEDKARYKKFVLLRECHRIYRQVRTICFAMTHFIGIKSRW